MSEICKYRDGDQCGLNRAYSVTDRICEGCIKHGFNKPLGLGDTVAATINKTPLRRLKKKGCGCRSRQHKLNKIVKYGNSGKPNTKSDGS